MLERAYTAFGMDVNRIRYGLGESTTLRRVKRLLLCGKLDYVTGDLMARALLAQTGGDESPSVVLQVGIEFSIRGKDEQLINGQSLR